MNETWLIPKHPNSSPKLKSLQDLSIRIKAKVTEETADHIGLRVNGGPKLPPHQVLESSNSLHHPLCLVCPITNIPLKGLISVGVPCRGRGSCSTAEPRRTVRVVRPTALPVLWVSTPITSVPLGLLRGSMWCGGVQPCCLHASMLSSVRWTCVAMAHVSHPCELQC
jgi:hypothetical protein